MQEVFVESFPSPSGEQKKIVGSALDEDETGAYFRLMDRYSWDRKCSFIHVNFSTGRHVSLTCLYCQLTDTRLPTDRTSPPLPPQLHTESFGHQICSFRTYDNRYALLAATMQRDSAVFDVLLPDRAKKTVTLLATHIYTNTGIGVGYQKLVTTVRDVDQFRQPLMHFFTNSHNEIFFIVSGSKSDDTEGNNRWAFLLLKLEFDIAGLKAINIAERYFSEYRKCRRATSDNVLAMLSEILKILTSTSYAQFLKTIARRIRRCPCREIKPPVLAELAHSTVFQVYECYFTKEKYTSNFMTFNGDMYFFSCHPSNKFGPSSSTIYSLNVSERLSYIVASNESEKMTLVGPGRILVTADGIAYVHADFREHTFTPIFRYPIFLEPLIISRLPKIEQKTAAIQRLAELKNVLILHGPEKSGKTSIATIRASERLKKNANAKIVVYTTRGVGNQQHWATCAMEHGMWRIKVQLLTDLVIDFRQKSNRLLTTPIAVLDGISSLLYPYDVVEWLTQLTETNSQQIVTICLDRTLLPDEMVHLGKRYPSFRFFQCEPSVKNGGQLGRPKFVDPPDPNVAVVPNVPQRPGAPFPVLITNDSVSLSWLVPKKVANSRRNASDDEQTFYRIEKSVSGGLTQNILYTVRRSEYHRGNTVVLYACPFRSSRIAPIVLIRKKRKLTVNTTVRDNIRGTKCTIADLKSDTTYQFRVIASNNEGHSDWSDLSKPIRCKSTKEERKNAASKGQASSSGAKKRVSISELAQRLPWDNKSSTMGWQKAVDELRQLCIKRMDNCYKEWREIFFRPVGQKNTLCIPPCIYGNVYQTSQELAMNKDASGQKAEDFVDKVLRTIGGLLLRVHSDELWWSAFGCNFRSLLKEDEEYDDDFEWDFLLVHPELSLVFIEVKAGGITNKLKYAIDQLKKAEKMLPQIYSLFFPNDQWSLPVKKVLCFPDFSDTSRAQKNCDILEKGVVFLGKNELSDPDSVKERLFSLYDDNEKENNFQAISGVRNVQDFLAILGGHRDLEYVSQAHNVLHMRHFINTQNVFGSEEQSGQSVVCLRNRPALESFVHLTPKQCKIRDCTVQHQIMWGPPGTGKTILLEMHIERAAKQSGVGRVCIYSKSEAHENNLKRFTEQAMRDEYRNIELNKIKIELEFQRSVVLIASTENPAVKLRDEDDFFADEMVLDDVTIQLLQRRSQKDVTGRTLIALTGLFNVTQINSAEEEITNALGSNLDKIWKRWSLQKLMRNSTEIANSFKHHFPNAEHGHRFQGEPIAFLPYTAITDMPNILFDHLKGYLRETKHPEDKEDEQKRPLYGRDIVIITEEEHVAKDLRAWLNDSGVMSGTAVEQLAAPHLIAVDHYRNTPSFEWTIVYAYGRRNALTDDTYGLIARSRAVAKLVVTYHEDRVPPGASTASAGPPKTIVDVDKCLKELEECIRDCVKNTPDADKKLQMTRIKTKLHEFTQKCKSIT